LRAGIPVLPFKIGKALAVVRENQEGDILEEGPNQLGITIRFTASSIATRTRRWR